MATQRGEYRKSAQRREEITEAAFAVFSRSGYAGSSVSDVAREAGMSMPGLLHHFDGKPALLQAVLENRDRQAQQLLHGKQGIDVFRTLIEISSANQHQRALIQLYASLAAEATNREHPAHEYFLKRSRLIVQEIAKAFETSQAMGQLRPGVSPLQAAIEVVAFTEGLQLLWLQGFVEVDLGEQARTFIGSYFLEAV